MSAERQTPSKAALKEKKRRRQQIFKLTRLGVILCALLALVLYLLSAFVFFKVEAVEVMGIADEEGNPTAGSSYYTAEEIISACNVTVGSSLVQISKENIATAVEKALPYIGNVTVKRKYPSTLRLVVEDTSPCFCTLADGIYTVMNSDFKVLETTSERPRDCSLLKGVSLTYAIAGESAAFRDEATASRLTLLREAAENNGVGNITAYDLTNIANVKIVHDNKVTFVVGTITELDEKLSLGVRTMLAELEARPSRRFIVDVTSPERSYVRDDYSDPEDETAAEPDAPTPDPTTEAVPDPDDGGDSDDFIDAVG